MSKLVLIDGNAVLHRAFHALPPLATKKGDPINAVYGLVSMLLRVIQDLKPTHIAVCFDEKEKTFRQKEFPSYQAQRPPVANELVSQFSKARDFLKASGIPAYSKGGYEADDVIGTIAEHATQNTIDEVIIVTGDRDQFQLIDDKVKVYMPVAGLSNGKLFGRDEVAEKMGVFPEEITVYKSLVGDPSDNYKGVSGIGPKTAIDLIKKHETLENIYENLNSVALKTREKLEKDKGNAFLSLKLATIVKDVPVDFDSDASSKWDVDSPKVIDLFVNEYGFKTLTERVKKVGKELDQQKQISLL